MVDAIDGKTWETKVLKRNMGTPLCPIHFSGDDLVLARECARFLAGGRCPAEQHPRASVADIAGTKVPGMNTAGVDVLATQTRLGLVQDLFVGPVVPENVFDIVFLGVTALMVWWKYGVRCFEVAIIERTIGIDGQVHGDECEMTG